jgi:FkbM family methyltransferase
MDRPPQDDIDTLLNGFRTLLESYRPADPDAAVNPADAFFMYRLLLGRNPNAAAELPALLHEPVTFRELRQGVLDSDEFAKGGSLSPPHRLWMTALEDFRFWFNTSDRDMGVVMATGQYEPESVRLIRKILRPGMTCIDAGAQTGFYTCLMASVVGEAGMVHAFEPMPASYELLVKNVQENRFEARVRTYRLACSNAATEIEASQVGAMYVAGAVPGCPPVSMRSIRVDEIVQEPVGLIKIDVEGHEPAAIEGMRDLIRRSHPVIVSECNEYWLKNCSGTSSGAYVGLLNSFGYHVFDINDLSVAVTPDSPVLQHLPIFDVIALPPESLDDDGRARLAVTT